MDGALPQYLDDDGEQCREQHDDVFESLTKRTGKLNHAVTIRMIEAFVAEQVCQSPARSKLRSVKARGFSIRNIKAER
jgi:hypothetical protein